MRGEYECDKCGNKSYETSEISATGGMLSKLFDVQTNKFTVITCTNCGYSELYKGETSTLSNIFDFLTD